MKRINLVDFFENLETEREYNGYFCSIPESVSIIILGSLCGLKNVKQIHQWASNEHISKFLKEKFQIEHIPCYYWLLVMLKMVKPESLNRCMMDWAMQFIKGKSHETTISLDGKTIRSTTGMKNIENPLHIISAQICELGITLASKTVNEKSNEIPAVQEVIRQLDIKGCLVVADALNCQRETAQAITDGKADYLLDAKANQPTLFQDISDYVQDRSLRSAMESKVTKEKSRDRIETRTAYVTDDISWLSNKEKWPALQSIGAIKTKFERNGTVSEEWHYYISSRKLTAEQLLHHARMEWRVETMHWLLDVHYEEDYCRIENKTEQQNMNMLRKFSLNLIRHYKNASSSKKAFSSIMLDCLIDCSKLCVILEN